MDSPPFEAQTTSQAIFEQMFAALSSRLARASLDDIDVAIEAALATLVQTMDADRSYVFLVTHEGRTVTCTHEWHRATMVSRVRQIVGVPSEIFPWGSALIRRGAPAILPDLDAAPPEASQEVLTLRSVGVRATVAVPLRVGERVLGSLHVDWARRRIDAAEPVLARLRLVADVVANTMQRREHESRLRASEDRIRSFIAHTSDAVWCFEPEGGIDVQDPVDKQFEQLLDAKLVECNVAYARLRGVDDAGLLLGASMRNVVREGIERLRTLYTELAAAGFRDYQAELRQATPSGRVVTVEARVQGTIAAGRLVRVWGTFRDVTASVEAENARRTLEAQLATAQRLESIGLLASGLAHDFNNVLTAIQASVRLATDDLARDPKLVRDALQQIDLACGRAAALTRQLLVFGGEQPLAPRPVSAIRIVDDLAGMLRRVIRESVELIVTHESGHVNIVADPLQIERALVNLCVNASDAVDARGRVVVRTKLIDLDDSPSTPHPEELGGGAWVVFGVEDDGHGIPPEVSSRMFEPFFTTKEASRGTGLGLALVFGIVRQHGGAMRVDSKVGVGTTFELWLPAAAREDATMTASPAGRDVDGQPLAGGTKLPPSPRTGAPMAHTVVRRAAAPGDLSPPDPSRATTSSGVHMGSSAASPPLAGADAKTVLVIEDDPLVRRLVHRILARADYEVVSASSGEEGVEQFTVLRDHIDVVLLDSVLPGISGAEVFAKLRALSPDIPVVFCSGYGDEGVPGGVDIPVLPKPYDRDALIEVLERARTSR